MLSSRGRPLGACIAGTKTSVTKRRPYSSMTAFCSASREPARENTPLLDRPTRSATAWSVIASSPSARARSSAPPTMAARVISLFWVLASMAANISTLVRKGKSATLGAQKDSTRQAHDPAVQPPGRSPGVPPADQPVSGLAEIGTRHRVQQLRRPLEVVHHRPRRLLAKHLGLLRPAAAHA